MNFPTDDQIPPHWPKAFRDQLYLSNSHLPIIQKIGIERASIGIFESFSMIKLPSNFPQIMKKVGTGRNAELDAILIGYEGQSAELANYSLVAVTLALRLLPGYEKKTKNVRKVIRLCTGEVLNHSLLCRDIETSAKKIARENMPKSGNTSLEIKSFYPQDMKSSNNIYVGRPVDWASSHWWSGE